MEEDLKSVIEIKQRNISFVYNRQEFVLFYYLLARPGTKLGALILFTMKLKSLCIPYKLARADPLYKVLATNHG